MEQWLDVIGFKGLYEVSNHGNVRSFKNKRLKKISVDKKLNRPFVNLWKKKQTPYSKTPQTCA